ncbi:MAG: DUF2130 domain-containing protein [Planctomycetaceae bacterium]|nr:DUF2130 domain-containing protein [Planctomycetaceae bacterium]
MKHSTKITCPSCGKELDVEEVLEKRIRQEEQQKFNAELAAKESEFKKKESALALQAAALKDQAAEIDKQVADKTKAELARKEKALIQQAEENAKSLYEVQLKSQSEETAELKKQVQESKATQIENARLKRQMESQEHANALELEKKLAQNDEQNRKQYSEQLKAEAGSIAKREAERNEKHVAELQKQLADAKKAAEDAVRKAEQGSQQLQGEVQELMIEDFLRATFPSDEIGEVKKGVSGADVKHIVRNRIGIESGIIIYESKNTKSFQNDWLDKLQSDAEQEKADLAVLVTKTMPKGMEHLSLINGVWVCSVSEFKGLVLALRENMIKLSEVRMAQINKGDKVQMLYDYLTDVRFAEQIRRVVLGFKELQEGYEKEKKAMQKIWKKRDEQLEMMWRNTTDFVTQIQVIAGSSFLQLEAPEEELLALTDDI